MRGIPIAATFLAAGLAGCLLAGGPGEAWVVEAPVWEPGFSWTWVATEGNRTSTGYLEVVGIDHRLGLDGFLLWDNGTRPFGPQLAGL